MRFVGHGHPAVRATHAKTLELAADPDITARATCVVAVAVHPEPARPLAGPVRITVTAGKIAFTFDALANPGWEPGGPAVIRRSPLRLPGTFATEATAAAADLPRDLVAALGDPATSVEVLVEPAPGPPTLVLFAADPARPADLRLAAELAAADAVVAEDRAARELVGRQLVSTVDPGGRTLVVATAQLPGSTVDRSAVRVDVVGLPPALAAAAANPSNAPLTLGGALATAPVAHRFVLPVGADDIAATLRAAARLHRAGSATLAQQYCPPVRLAADLPVALARHATAYLCLDPAVTDDALDPTTLAAIEELLAAGVATKTAAAALARLTGWPRRRAYDAVLARARLRA